VLQPEDGDGLSPHLGATVPLDDQAASVEADGERSVGVVHGRDPANNTVDQRTSKACTFLRWCQREGHIDRNPAEHLRDPDSPLRTFRRTFGKVQTRHPGRWLTHDEADGRLVGTCHDGTIVGLRDEIVIRLGLAGMRLAEIGSLRVGDVERLPLITWTGKGHTPRKMVLDRAAAFLD
jgi:integrase